MASQAKILEGSSVGQIIADQQALMALVAYRSNRKYAYEVRDSANVQRTLADGATAGDLNYELMSSTAGFKTNQLGNQSDFAQMDAIKPLSEVLGTLSKTSPTMQQSIWFDYRCCWGNNRHQSTGCSSCSHSRYPLSYRWWLPRHG